MYKLFSAQFSRLWKDKIFWICMGAMLVYSLVFILSGCRQAMVDLSEYNYSIDKYYFHFAVTIGGFCALFSSMFLGTEYNDGTIRNKLIVGHTRTNLYLSNLIVIFVATLLLLLVAVISGMVGIPVLGVWKMGFSNLLLYFVLVIFMVAAFSAIFTFVCMLSSNKAVTIVISILLCFGLVFIASMIDNSLSQPEVIRNGITTVNGVEMGEPMPNPYYLSGIQRVIYEFLLDFLPTGQGLQIMFLEISTPIRMIVSSIVITIVMTFSGIILFKRKNLK